MQTVDDPASIWAFFTKLAKWWPILMCGPVSVPFAFLAAYYGNAVSAMALWGTLAILSIVFACYFAWREMAVMANTERAGRLSAQATLSLAQGSSDKRARDDRARAALAPLLTSGNALLEKSVIGSDGKIAWQRDKSAWVSEALREIAEFLSIDDAHLFRDVSHAGKKVYSSDHSISFEKNELVAYIANLRSIIDKLA